MFYLNTFFDLLLMIIMIRTNNDQNEHIDDRNIIDMRIHIDMYNFTCISKFIFFFNLKQIFLMIMNNNHNV
jgi:hypothetical protein